MKEIKLFQTKVGTRPGDMVVQDPNERQRKKYHSCYRKEADILKRYQRLPTRLPRLIYMNEKRKGYGANIVPSFFS